MSKKLVTGLVLAGLMTAMCQGAYAEEEDLSKAAGDSEADDKAFLTGLDFSYWASEKENRYGPGLSWGLVLVPRHLEMLLTVGAMIGQKTYTIPVELRFAVPFELASWLDLFVMAGPTLLFDRVSSTWKHDIAASAALGLELKPPDFGWGLRVQGDYNLHLVKEVVHTGGFTVGFLYRF